MYVHVCSIQYTDAVLAFINVNAKSLLALWSTCIPYMHAALQHCVAIINHMNKMSSHHHGTIVV